jgi:hypothetical protein
MNLREGVEDGAGRLVKLDRAANFERAGENPFGTLQFAELHEDLPQCCERHGQPVSRAECLVQRHASFGECKRLFVMVTHQRDVRLVVHDAREHVIGLNRHCEALTLRRRGRRFFAPSRLCEQNR